MCRRGRGLDPVGLWQFEVTCTLVCRPPWLGPPVSIDSSKMKSRSAEEGGRVPFLPALPGGPAIFKSNRPQVPALPALRCSVDPGQGAEVGEGEAIGLVKRATWTASREAPQEAGKFPAPALAWSHPPVRARAQRRPRPARDNPEPSHRKEAEAGWGRAGVPRRVTRRVWADPGLPILRPFRPLSPLLRNGARKEGGTLCTRGDGTQRAEFAFSQPPPEP